MEQRVTGVGQELVKGLVQVAAAYVAARATSHVLRQAWASPPGAKGWHTIMRVCQRIALAAGRAGVYAEDRYRRAVQ